MSACFSLGLNAGIPIKEAALPEEQKNFCSKSCYLARDNRWIRYDLCIAPT